MARSTIAAMQRQFATQREMDRVALKLVESVGVEQAYKRAMPVIDYAKREILQVRRRAGQSREAAPQQARLF